MLTNNSDETGDVNELFLVDDDPKRRLFLEEYIRFLLSRERPMRIVPVIGRHPLDLFKLYQVVKCHGGFCQVVKKRRWSRVVRELDFPMPITAFSLRTNYLRHLYEFECTKMGKPVPDFIKWANHENTQENGEDEESDIIANKTSADQPTKIVTTAQNVTTGQSNVAIVPNGVTNIVPSIISISQVKPIMRSYVKPILPKVTTTALVATNHSITTGSSVVRNANLVTVAPWGIANTFLAGAHNVVAGQTIPMSQVNVFAPPVSQNRNVVAVTPDGKVISAPLYAPKVDQSVTKDNVTAIPRTSSEIHSQQVKSSNGINQPLLLNIESQDDVLEVFPESSEPGRPKPSLNAGRNYQDSLKGDKVAAATQTVVDKIKDDAARENLSWIANKGCLKCSCCGRDITGDRGKPLARQLDDDLMPVASKRRRHNEEKHNQKGSSHFEGIVIVDDTEEEQDIGPNSDEILRRIEQKTAVSPVYLEPSTQSRQFTNKSPPVLTTNASRESDNANSLTNFDAVKEPCPPLIRIEDIRNEKLQSISEDSPRDLNIYSGSTTQSAITLEEITRPESYSDALARMSAKHTNPSAAFMTASAAASPSTVTSRYFDRREALNPFSVPSTMPPLLSSSPDQREQASENLSTGNYMRKSPCQCRTLGCYITSQRKSSTEIFSPPLTGPRTRIAPADESPVTTSPPLPGWIPSSSHKTSISMPRLIRSDAVEAAANRTKIMPVLQQPLSLPVSRTIADDAPIETAITSATTPQGPYFKNHVNEHRPETDESHTIFSRPNVTHENNVTDVSFMASPMKVISRTSNSSQNIGSISSERLRAESPKKQNGDDATLKRVPAFGFEINEQTEKSLSLVIHLNGLRYEGILFS